MLNKNCKLINKMSFNTQNLETRLKVIKKYRKIKKTLKFSKSNLILASRKKLFNKKSNYMRRN